MIGCSSHFRVDYINVNTELRSHTGKRLVLWQTVNKLANISNSNLIIVWRTALCLKKLCTFVFVSTASNFHQLWQFLAGRWRTGAPIFHLVSTHYTVSQKKTSKIIFVIIMPNFHQMWRFLAQTWQRVQNYTRCIHFPPHLIHVNALPC